MMMSPKHSAPGAATPWSFFWPAESHAIDPDQQPPAPPRAE
jgi:hypothetical protein